jgi:hypothetical protein
MTIVEAPIRSHRARSRPDAARAARIGRAADGVIAGYLHDLAHHRGPGAAHPDRPGDVATPQASRARSSRAAQPWCPAT